MNINDIFHSEKTKVCPPAQDSQILAVEAKLSQEIPADLRKILEVHDGGLSHDSRLLIYSAGVGLHPSETLISANLNRNTSEPLLFFARCDNEEFAFHRMELQEDHPAVYLYIHEEDSIKMIAGSLFEFLSAFLKI